MFLNTEMYPQINRQIGTCSIYAKSWFKDFKSFREKKHQKPAEPVGEQRATGKVRASRAANAQATSTRATGRRRLAAAAGWLQKKDLVLKQCLDPICWCFIVVPQKTLCFFFFERSPHFWKKTGHDAMWSCYDFRDMCTGDMVTVRTGRWTNAFKEVKRVNLYPYTNLFYVVVSRRV